jgi:hypothetical protein
VRDLLVARLRNSSPRLELLDDDFVRLAETVLPEQELADEHI